MVEVKAIDGDITIVAKDKDVDSNIAINRIWDKGVLCQIQSAVWSMEVKLEPKDLNMNNEEIPTFMRLGTKRLLPQTVRDEFNKHIWNAKSSAKKYGIPYFITNSFFIPLGNMDNLTERIDKERKAFYERLENFLTRYAPLRDEYLTANDNYRHILEQHYPSPEIVRSKFKFNVVYYKATIDAVSLNDIGSAEEVYLEWAISASNSLREEARGVADKITQMIKDGKNDGRPMTRVNTLLDKVQKMDILADDSLLKATKQLANAPSITTADKLKEIAKEVNPLYVRKVLLD
tara:strand:+ start:445 stop:1314 length:870 start_codon:yes stop_codon:yes gene_type:complete